MIPRNTSDSFLFHVCNFQLENLIAVQRIEECNEMYPFHSSLFSRTARDNIEFERRKSTSLLEPLSSGELLPCNSTGIGLKSIQGYLLVDHLNDFM